LIAPSGRQQYLAAENTDIFKASAVTRFNLIMSKNSLTELLAQKAALEQQIADAQRLQRADAIQQVRTLMSEYGLTVADIGSKNAAAPKKAAAKVAAKYRNAATGDSWSGRGLKPKWLTAALASGRSLGDFAV
jgi:DNA-binding protein H-NS